MMRPSCKPTPGERRTVPSGRGAIRSAGRPGLLWSLVAVLALLGMQLPWPASGWTTPAAAQEVVIVPTATPPAGANETPVAPLVDFIPAIGGFPFQTQPFKSTGPSRVAYSPDGAVLAVGTSSGVFLYNASSLQLNRYVVTDSPAISLAYSPDGDLIAIGHYTGDVQWFGTNDGKRAGAVTTPQGAVNALAFSLGGVSLATGAADGTIRVWRTSDGASLGVWTGHIGAVWHVRYSPDGEWIASGGADGTVRLWRAEDGTSLSVLDGIAGGVTGLAFSPNGRTLAIGAGDGSLRFWTLRTGEVSTSVAAHQGGVTDVTFSPDGAYVASSSYDLTVAVQPAADGAPVQTLHTPDSAIASLAVMPNGTILATGALDGSVQLWSFPPTSETPSAPATCNNSAEFIVDVTVPDYTVLGPGSPFHKTWRVRNTGTCAWDKTYVLQYLGGDIPPDVTVQPLPVTPSGAPADLTVMMYTPAAPGTYRSTWQLVSSDGRRFGPRLTAVIQVPAPPTPIPTATPLPYVQIWADRTTINAGESVTVHARVANVQAAWLDDQPIVYNYSEKTVQLCETQTFTANAIVPNGERVAQSVTVNVNGSCTEPTARLRIKELWADDLQPQVGQTVRLTLQVRNEGDKRARDFDVLWRPSESARYQVVASGRDLDEDDSMTVEWDYTFGTAGRFESKARLNFDGHETHRELLFVVSPSPAPTAGNPSLRLSGLKADTVQSEVGQTVRFTAEIANRGDGPAYDARLVWRPSRNTSFSLVQDGLNIAAGKQAQVTFEYAFPASGTYDTQAVVTLEARDLSAEPGLLNDSNSATLTIQVVPVSALPTSTPTTAPTDTPVPPTAEPVPTEEPVVPTEEPLLPTEAPVLPTEEPLLPTEEPVLPTAEPPVPTEEPLLPTEEPLPPTEEPAIPTEEPPLPTEEPLPPTEEPTVPTEEPPIPTEEPTVELFQLPPQPEVVLGDIMASSLYVEVGRPITFEVELRNRGDLMTEGFTLLARPAPDVPFRVITSDLLLLPDAELPVEFEFSFSTPGRYLVEALVTTGTPETAERSANPSERASLTVEAVEPPLDTAHPAPPHLRVRLRASNRNPRVGDPVEFLAQIENRSTAEAVAFAVAFRPSADVPFQVIARDLSLAPGSLMELNWEYAFPAPGPHKAEVEVQNVPAAGSDFARINVK